MFFLSGEISLNYSNLSRDSDIPTSAISGDKEQIRKE